MSSSGFYGATRTRAQPGGLNGEALATGGAPGDPQKDRELARLRQTGLLDSYARMEEYGYLLYQSAGELCRGTAFSHIPTLKEKYGGETLLALNEGLAVGSYFDPGGHVGFEDGLIGLLK